jgi:hypothetical protein
VAAAAPARSWGPRPFAAWTTGTPDAAAIAPVPSGLPASATITSSANPRAFSIASAMRGASW